MPAGCGQLQYGIFHAEREFLEEGWVCRAHAAPDVKRFGGLLDQHAESVGDAAHASAGDTMNGVSRPYIMS